MIDREGFVAYLLLMGFEQQHKSLPSEPLDEQYAYRMGYGTFKPAIITVRVFKRKATAKVRKINRGSATLSLVEGFKKQSVQGPQSQVLRWLKDHAHVIIERAEKHGYTKL